MGHHRSGRRLRPVLHSAPRQLHPPLCGLHTDTCRTATAACAQRQLLPQPPVASGRCRADHKTLGTQFTAARTSEVKASAPAPVGLMVRSKWSSSPSGASNTSFTPPLRGLMGVAVGRGMTGGGRTRVGVTRAAPAGLPARACHASPAAAHRPRQRQRGSISPITHAMHPAACQCRSTHLSSAVCPAELW